MARPPTWGQQHLQDFDYSPLRQRRTARDAFDFDAFEFDEDRPFAREFKVIDHEHLPASAVDVRYFGNALFAISAC